MTVTHGMNISEVDALGRLLQRSGDRLREVVGELERLVFASLWEGEDAAVFQQNWPTHKASLLAAAEGIFGFGQSALNNVTEQAEASGDTFAGTLYGAHGIIGGIGVGAIPSLVVGRTADGSPGGIDVLDLLGTGLEYSEFLNFVGLVGDIGVTPQGLMEMLGSPGSPPSMLGPAGDLLGRGFAYLELGGNLYRMGDAALHGDGGQVVMNGVGAGLTIWGMSNPYVAAGYTAWNGGWAIGEGIANIPAVETFMVDDSFNNHLMDEYGSTELTSAQAAEASQRYDGVGGFINYGHDVLENAGEKLNPMNWFD